MKTKKNLVEEVNNKMSNPKWNKCKANVYGKNAAKVKKKTKCLGTNSFLEFNCEVKIIQKTSEIRK